MSRTARMVTSREIAFNPSWIRDLHEILLKNNILSLSSSLAYYTVLSITPFLLLVFAAMSFIGWHNYPALQRELIETLGPTVEMAVLSIQSRLHDGGAVVDFGIFSLLTFVLSSMGIVSELQRSLNMVLLGREPHPAISTREAIMDWVKTRVSALIAMIFCIAVILGSFALAIAFRFFIQAQNETLWEVVRFTASFLIFSGVFFFLFRYLPWQKQTIGFSARAGLICSCLFHIGKYLIETYFLRVDMSNGYGALSSFVLLLLWAYYNALIILFSACLSKALFSHHQED